jgi:hypothetical protein
MDTRIVNFMFSIVHLILNPEADMIDDRST